MSRPTDDALFGFLVEQSPDGVFILLDSRLVYLNGAAQRMFGLTLERGRSVPLVDVLDPADHDRALRNVALREQGALTGATVYQARRSDGSTFPIEVHAAPLQLRGRRGLHGVIRDVTDLRRLEARLEDLERSSFISRLARGIAHDFNNLLAVIQSSAEVASRGRSRAELEAALTRIHGAVRRGSEKVRQIQQVGSLGGDPEALRPLHLAPLVEDAIDLTRARWQDEADSQGVAYRVGWEPQACPSVEASPSDVRSALVALIFNAIEAMPEGGELILRTRTGELGEAVIEVEDTGEGISEPDLRKLSDPFFTTRGDRTMGLGLGLVAGVVERAGGRMEVESLPGSGTRFSLHLPASEVAPDQPPPPPRSGLLARDSGPTVPEPERPRTRGGRSVLLIDDQADLVQVVRTILESKGFAVDSALRGQEGVALAVASKYSVVLTDLGMPDISGWEVAQRVHEVQPETPVVLMTGWAADIEPERLAEARIRALLPKPFRSDELLQLIGGVLEPSQTEQLS